MTNVSGSRGDAPVSRMPQRASGTQPGPQTAKPEDVRAMSDAFAAARNRMTLDPFGGKAGGKQHAGQKAMLADLPARGTDQAKGEAAMLAGAFERASAERSQAERFAEGQGFAAGGQPAPLAPPPIQLAQVPAPQVDPSGFAQMLADLWTRENGRGSKEVRVRFGADAWPATGALLVQSADGLLDVAVDVVAGQAGVATDALRDALGASGLTIGQVTAG